MTAPTTFPVPSDDPRFVRAETLLKFGGWLRASRALLDVHRREFSSFKRYDEDSLRSSVLVELLEAQVRGLDHLIRETARASARLANDAFSDALRVCLPIDPLASGDIGAKP